MTFYATARQNWKQWDFLIGNSDMSISVSRYKHLLLLNNISENMLKIAIKDIHTDQWTTWRNFIGSKTFLFEQLSTALDIHRSTLPEELVIESDYPTYEENYDAARVIGTILEQKGFQPLYYYSGNKSIHIHLYFAFTSLLNLDLSVQNQLMDLFKTKSRFIKVFMGWLGNKICTCWDTDIRQFDEQAIMATHLIRSELSRNKLGYKTYIGDTYKDISMIPYICNEQNRIYPKVGQIKYSAPYSIQDIIEEFLIDRQQQTKTRNRRAKEKTLNHWLEPIPHIRPSVKKILNDNFEFVADGKKRGFFILINELKRVYDPAQVKIIVDDWNNRMGHPIRNAEIKYKLTDKIYHLSDRYIDSFLQSVKVPKT